MRENGPDRFRHGTARLRLPLHLLHRSDTRGGRSGAGSLADVVREVAGLVEQGTHRSHAAGANRQQLSRRRARLCRPCSAPSGGSTVSDVSGLPAHTQPISRRGSSRPWRRRPRYVSTSICRYRADPTPCSGACSGATPGSGIWKSWQSCAGPFPGITFSTDIIVGFPGETDAQFRKPSISSHEADFDDAYTFKYSVREGTPAVRLRDHVADEVASTGWTGSSRWCAASCGRKNMARIGQTHEALVERPARRGDLMLARTRTIIWSCWTCRLSAIGEYHSVRLTGTTGSTFTGRGPAFRWRSGQAQLAVL